MAFDRAIAAVEGAIVKSLLGYLADNPEKNLASILKWGETIATAENHKNYCRTWSKMMADEGNNWRALAVRLFRETSPTVRNRLAVNFFLNAGALQPARVRKMEEKHGVHIPWAILIDPTGKCNLRCKGCWAADYDRTADMDFATIDRVLTQAEELGIHFFVLSGGEPAVRMDDVLALARKHNESVFHMFTNGTLISEEVAGKVAEAGNITFAISIEGLEESTDARRGPGVFNEVIQAMDNLHKAGAVYGFSATYTRVNTEEIAGEAFIDLMIEKGCALGWLFTYVPVGGAGDLEYMATPDQRALMFRQVRKWRAEKPIFVADFWNDGEAVGGCIAGGECYFHINSVGEVEPCAFIHYSNLNIKEASVLDALRSPLFQAYQKNRPFNKNLLRPCPLIDNPEWLEAMVEESGARPTEMSRVSAANLCRPLHGYAEGWGRVADALWKETHVDKPVG